MENNGMNNQQFYESFTLARISFSKKHSTNHARDSGSPKNYIGMMICGNGFLKSGGKEIKLGVGDTFFIPKGCKYCSFWYPEGAENDFNKEAAEVSWYSVGFEFLPIANGRVPDIQKFCCDGEVKAAIEKTALGKADCTTVGSIYGIMGKVGETLEYSDIVPELALKFEMYIRENLTASISEAARHCKISESQLYAKIKDVFGTTPGFVRQKLMCEAAAELLVTTDLPIEEISGRVGFSSSSYFRKLFAKHMGKAPREFRKKYRY